jgi:uncharacterized oligopeptide transporter (OPT) family protein
MSELPQRPAAGPVAGSSAAGSSPADTGPDPRGDGLFQTRYREVTPSALVFGVVFGVIINAAITYAGLKIGFTIVASAIAAVLGVGVLRGLLRRGSILETNIGQTVASAINQTCAGVIFTVPVLLLLGFELSFSDPDFWLITAACMAGAVLGCVFIVPLRKQMLDIERLRFPSATAVGAILRSPGAGARKSLVLVAGILLSMLIYAPTALPMLGVEAVSYSALGWRLPAEPAADGGGLSARVDRDRDGRPDLILTDTALDAGRALGLPGQFFLVFAIAPFALGAGYLTGRAGLLVLAGGVLAYLILNPVVYQLGWLPATVAAGEVADYALQAYNRPLGIGLLLGGALLGVIASLPAIREALRSIRGGARSRAGRDELGVRPLVLIALPMMAAILLVTELIGSGGHGGWLAGLNPWLARAIIALVALAWIWFAGIIIAQCTGMTDWSPVSGMALLTVVLVLMLAGQDDVLSAVMLGAALCVAIGCAADMMADLRTGYIVGAQPRRQQVVEIASVAIGPLVSMATIVLIVNANLAQTGIPIGPGTDTVAPQAQALEAVILGVQGGELPYALYGFGALLGALLGLAAFPSLGVLVGLSMYLPVKYILTYGLGCLLNMLVVRVKGRAWAEEWGVPLCAGLIVGEALLALVFNGIVIAGG